LRQDGRGALDSWAISVKSVLTKSSTERRWSVTASAAADLAGRALPFVLSLTAGSTDIIGFLGLNGLFTAHITGNLVVLAARNTRGHRGYVRRRGDGGAECIVPCRKELPQV
jgi:hypothetical protein